MILQTRIIRNSRAISCRYRIIIRLFWSKRKRWL